MTNEETSPSSKSYLALDSATLCRFLGLDPSRVSRVEVVCEGPKPVEVKVWWMVPEPGPCLYNNFPNHQTY